MTIFEDLEQATLVQYEEGELPRWLAEPALLVARNPGRHSGQEELVALLAEQIRGYDPFADTGCCKWTYDHEDISRTLHRLGL